VSPLRVRGIRCAPLVLCALHPRSVMASSSRFFATGDSSDDSRSASGSDEEVDVMSTQLGGAGQVKLVYSSSESEEEKRTIRSAKDKAFEHIAATCKAMLQHLRIGDYTSVTRDWEALGKQMEKAKAVVAKEGVPAFYLTAMAQLNQSLNDTFANKDEVKKMSSMNSKALTALRTKVKKQLLTQPLQGQIEAHLKKNPLPVAAAEDESSAAAGSGTTGAAKGDSESESSESDGGKPAAKKKPAGKKPAGKKAAESSSSSSSESEDERKKPAGKKPAAKKPAGKKAAESSSSSSSSSSSESDSDSDSDSSSSSESSSSDSDMDSSDSGSDAAAGNAWFTREFWLKKEYKKNYKV
jgi:translation initiation factor 3 subunit C